MSNIKHLEVLEEPLIEYASLEALFDRIGKDQSRDLLENSIFELSDRLWLLEKAFYDGSLDDAKKVSASFCTLADEIGLVEFSKVASDLVNCIARNDYVATQAVASRLVRVGERSLYQIVQRSDLSNH